MERGHYWNGKHLTDEMKEKISLTMKGHPNYNKGGYSWTEEQKEAKRKYKVGDFRIKRGRRMIMVEDREWKLYYRYLMEQEIGRPLIRSELVHHIDGNPLNDDLENLEVVTLSQHNTIHRKGVPKFEW